MNSTSTINRLDLKDFIRNSLKKLLKLSDLNNDTPLNQYGLDSISNIELVNMINGKFQIEVSPTLFFELSDVTVTTLTDFIYDEYIHSTEQDREETSIEGENSQIENSLNYDDLVSSFENENNLSSLFSNEEDSNKQVVRFVQTESESLDNIKLAKTDEIENDDIVIVGIGGRFPQSRNPREFWENLSSRTKMITKIPRDRFDCEKYEKEMHWGSFLDDVKSFDAQFFGIKKIEADYMDPQHRLFIETTWETIEDAGYKISELTGSKTGVFVGISGQDYAEVLRKSNADKTSPYALTGVTSFMLPNRISSLFDFKGPSEPLDTACSSSLVALNRAIEAIKNSDCDSAIVGGVNLILTPTVYASFNSVGMLNDKPVCKVFDSESNGTIRSEGVGAIFIKRYRDAVRDHDHIYAVIQASGVGHKGTSSSLTAPNSLAQTELLERIYEKNKIVLNTIDYIETHSTGTKLGDLVEINALSDVFSRGNIQVDDDYLPTIGSLKSYVGHMEAAAGIGAIIKTVLSMENECMLGINNLENLNEFIDLEKAPFRFKNKNAVWKSRDVLQPKRAAVSAFGFGGVDAHVVLEQPIHEVPKRPYKKSRKIFVLSAKTKGALFNQAKQFLMFLNDSELNNRSIEDLCFTLQMGREAFEYRLSFVVETIADIRKKLRSFLDKKENIVLSGAASKEVLKEFFDDNQEIERVIQEWISSDKLEKVSKMWVKGLDIPWECLYNDELPRRIPLPTYPFEKENHWVDSELDEVEIRNDEGKDNADEFIEPQKSTLKNFNFKDEITKIISDYTECPKEALKSETSLSDIGVDSIILTQLLNVIKKYTNNFDPIALYNAKTIGDVLSLNQNVDIEPTESSEPTFYTELIKLNDVEEGRPIFWFHGGFGGVEIYRFIAQEINRPFYGIQAKGYLNFDQPLDEVEKIASYYFKIIKSIQVTGSYDLGGLSFGGTIAYEVAKQLESKQESVSSLIMIESIFVDDEMKESWSNIPEKELTKDRLYRIANLLLSFSNEQEEYRLIESNEIDEMQNSDDFLDELIQLAISKGIKKEPTQLRKLLIQMDKTLYGLDKAATFYTPKECPGLKNAKSFYFGNTTGSLFGDKESAYRLVDKGRTYNYVQYYESWKKLLPNLAFKEIKSDSHLTILTEQQSIDRIVRTCKKIYL